MLITTALSIGAFRLKAEVREEQFSSDPSDRGWVAFGNAELFRWDSEHARLAVTWDTANPTSFFAWPLGTSLQSDADFSVSFELGLLDAAGGIHAGRPGAMQVALGFLNWQRATHEAFQRGAGKAAETLEFNWFPEGTIPGYGVVEPTLSAITFDASSQVKAGFEFPFELAPLVPYRVELDYQGVNRVLTARLTNPGIPSSQVSVSLGSSFGPLALDAFAIMVWDERTSFADSLVAHGWVDDVRIVLPEPPIRNLRIAAADGQSVEFESLVGWSYRLEASYGLIGWSETGTTASGNGGTLRLVDEREILATQQFYRVTAVHN